MTTSKKIVTNFFWRFFERCGAQLVTFLVSIVLARLLDPSVYGEIALVTVFICILQVFIDSGLGTALIQKKNTDDIDFSSVFYFNIIACISLYTLIFIFAPYISGFYNLPNLTSIIRVLGLTLIISGIRNVQQSYISKKLMFKKFFFATMGGTIAAAIVGICLAYNNFGAWSLVGQQLTNISLGTIILWGTVEWRPKLLFSLQRLKGLLNYGWKILATALIDTGYNQSRQLIIGKVYSPNDLAFFNQGHLFPSVIVTNINASIDSVLLPSMSAEQDNILRIKEMTQKAISISSYIMMPIMMALAVCAEPLVSIVLTDKWLPCVPFLRIFCFVYAFHAIHTANLNAIKSLGKSEIILKLEILRKTISIIALISTMWISVMAIAYSQVVTCILSQMINAKPNKKLLNYSYISQLKDMLPSITLSIFCGSIAYSLKFFNLSCVKLLILQITTLTLSYLGLSILLHIKNFHYIVETVKRIIIKK